VAGWVVAATIRSPVGSRLVAPGTGHVVLDASGHGALLARPQVPRQSARKYAMSAEKRTARSQACLEPSLPR
jgi:hypothetical protein